MDVEDVQTDEGSVQIGGFVGVRNLLDDLDAVEFAAVRNTVGPACSPLMIYRYLDWITEIRLTDFVPEVSLLAGLDIRLVAERRRLLVNSSPSAAS